MDVAIFPNRKNRIPGITEMRDTESFDWVKVAACGSLITGSLLLLSGKKRAGLVMAASGTALALLDHEDTLRNLWESAPSYVERAQHLLGQVQDVVENIAEKGETLRRALSRRS
jgi:hypothetical protein